MQIAMIGLGRMGLNMVKRLLKDGHSILAYAPSEETRAKAAALGATAVASISELKSKLAPPRVAWIMVPHGKAVDNVIEELMATFDAGDIIIDGGNSHFLESIEHSKLVSKKGLNFADVGVSGGIFGLERGYCLMVGATPEIFSHLEPLFKTLAPGESAAPKTKSRTSDFSSAHRGYLLCGPAGAGHYVKMIHNAIEYGMMQSFAEGLEILHKADSSDLPESQRYQFDLREISELWRRGSVVGSWLLDLLSEAFHKDPHLSEFQGFVPDSGEGRWALMEAIKQSTPASNLANSLFTRFSSRKTNPFAEKSLSALRKEFGGHQESSGGSKK